MEHEGVAVEGADLVVLAVRGQQQHALVGADAHLGKILGEPGQGLPRPRVGEEQGQRLARLGRAEAVVQVADMAVSLVGVGFLADRVDPEGAVVGPPAGREVGDARHQGFDGTAVQVKEANVGEAFFLAGEGKAARVAQPGEVAQAAPPLRGENAVAAARLQHLEPAAADLAAARQPAQLHGDAPAVRGDLHRADVHRVQHVFHAAAPPGLQRGLQRRAGEGGLFLERSLQDGDLAGTGIEDALDQQQVLAVEQGQRHAALARGGRLGQRLAVEVKADGERGLDREIGLEPAPAFQVDCQVDRLPGSAPGEARGPGGPGQLLPGIPLYARTCLGIQAGGGEIIEIQGGIGTTGEGGASGKDLARSQDQPAVDLEFIRALRENRRCHQQGGYGDHDLQFHVFSSEKMVLYARVSQIEITPGGLSCFQDDLPAHAWQESCFRSLAFRHWRHV